MGGIIPLLVSLGLWTGGSWAAKKALTPLLGMFAKSAAGDMTRTGIGKAASMLPSALGKHVTPAAMKGLAIGGGSLVAGGVISNIAMESMLGGEPGDHPENYPDIAGLLASQPQPGERNQQTVLGEIKQQQELIAALQAYVNGGGTPRRFV